MSRLLAVSVGRPRECEWQGRIVRTSILKTEVPGRVRVRTTNVDGDEQSDLTVHGGPGKAVYAYPSEHYPEWKRELGDFPLPWGAFGENLSTLGLLEPEVNIGDCFRIGTAEFQVTQPRSPCMKLGIRFQRLDMTRLFFESGRSGFYLAVVREGEVGAGDRIERIVRDPGNLSVADVVALDSSPQLDPPLLRRAAEHPQLSAGRRERYRKQLSEQHLR